MKIDSSATHHIRNANKGCRGNWPGKPAVFVLLLPALLCVAPASAGPVIFSNGANPPTTFPTSDRGDPPNSGQLIQILADDFILTPGSDTITDVHWTGRYFPDPLVTTTDVFEIDICTDVGFPGICGALTFVSPVSRILNAGGYFDYDVNVAPLKVVGAHWISIFNNTADPNIQWLWGAQRGGNSWITNNGDAPASGPWRLGGNTLDFELTGVPEPATLALVSLSLAGLGFSRRKVSDRILAKAARRSGS